MQCSCTCDKQGKIIDACAAHFAYGGDMVAHALSVREMKQPPAPGLTFDATGMRAYELKTDQLKLQAGGTGSIGKTVTVLISDRNIHALVTGILIAGMSRIPQDELTRSHVFQGAAEQATVVLESSLCEWLKP